MIAIMLCVLALAIYYVGKIIWLSWEQYKVTITAAWRGKTYSEDLFYELTIRCGFLVLFIGLFTKLATFIL